MSAERASPTGDRRPRYGEGRQALLDAAVRVVAQRGLRGLTYRAVAAEAGVTQGLVAFHFGSRDALIHEALLSAGEASVGETLDTGTTATLDAFPHDLPAFVERTRELQAFQFELVMEAQRRPELLEDIRTLYDSYVAATGEALRAAGLEPTEELQSLVFAALDGLVLQQLIYHDPARTETALTALRRLLAETGAEKA